MLAYRSKRQHREISIYGEEGNQREKIPRETRLEFCFITSGLMDISIF